MCVWVGSRVGVGSSYCSMHFSPSPSRGGMDSGSCHLTCECFKGSPGVFRKLSFFAPPNPIFQQEAAWSFWATVRPRGGALLVEKGREWEKKPVEGKGGTLPPSCLVQAQPERQQWGWECHRLVVTWNWHNLTSMWKLLLAGNCGSSTEPLEYIVSIWAHYPIGGGVNKEGIPLSPLPQQRRKGEEQHWWEEKWSEGRGGVHCEGKGGHCLPVTVGNGKAWVIRAGVSVCRKCVWMWACVNEWTWLSMR